MHVLVEINVQNVYKENILLKSYMHLYQLFIQHRSSGLYFIRGGGRLDVRGRFNVFYWICGDGVLE